jgi:hypothetical protein
MIIKIMSLQEILEKDPKRWKLKECNEVLKNPSSTEEQKKVASDRSLEIKEWLRNKDQGNTKPSGTITKVFTNEPVDIDSTKIELHASEMEAIRKAVHEKNQIILVKLEQIRKDLALHNIHNPALEGLLLKIHENVE